ncbi:MAG: hypothetical protein JJE44_11990 [Flavobacteriaceae bacterium]|nr:hypothetical protein [Flavobacteriaceae bacterium]
MKNNNYIIIIVLMVFNLISYKGYTQQTNEDTYIINQYFQSNKEASLILESKGLDPAILQSKNNAILLNQVGNSNQIDIKSSINNAQTVSQFGNNNDYQFINYYNSSASNFNILQQGNSNSLQIYGENSLIKNIGIVQNTNFKTLIIKNY